MAALEDMALSPEPHQFQKSAPIINASRIDADIEKALRVDFMQTLLTMQSSIEAECEEEKKYIRWFYWTALICVTTTIGTLLLPLEALSDPIILNVSVIPMFTTRILVAWIGAIASLGSVSLLFRAIDWRRYLRAKVSGFHQLKLQITVAAQSGSTEDVLAQFKGFSEAYDRRKSWRGGFGRLRTINVSLPQFGGQRSGKAGGNLDKT